MDVNIIDILPYIFIALNVLCNIISMVYTRHTGKSIDKEVSNLRYKTLDVAQAEKPAQEFDKLVTQYELNKRTDELVEKEDKLDIQALIDSAVTTCLEQTLARLMPDQVQEDDGLVNEYDAMQDDLDVLLDCYDVADEYRSKLGLADDVPVEQVFEAMQKQAQAIKAQLDKKQAQKQEVNHEQTQENISTQQSQDVQEHSKKSA